MNSFNDIFEMMKKSLDLSPTAMNLWINPIKPVKLNNNKVVLYIDIFKKQFKEILGFDVEIEYLS